MLSCGGMTLKISLLLQELLEKSRAGVVASLIAACAREGVQQAAACQALAAAVRELNAQDAVRCRHVLLLRGLATFWFAVAQRSNATGNCGLLCMSHDVPVADQRPLGGLAL